MAGLKYIWKKQLNCNMILHVVICEGNGSDSFSNPTNYSERIPLEALKVTELDKGYNTYPIGGEKLPLLTFEWDLNLLRDNQSELARIITKPIHNSRVDLDDTKYLFTTYDDAVYIDCGTIYAVYLEIPGKNFTQDNFYNPVPNLICIFKGIQSEGIDGEFDSDTNALKVKCTDSRAYLLQQINFDKLALASQKTVTFPNYTDSLESQGGYFDLQTGTSKPTYFAVSSGTGEGTEKLWFIRLKAIFDYLNEAGTKAIKVLLRDANADFEIIVPDGINSVIQYYKQKYDGDGALGDSLEFKDLFIIGLNTAGDKITDSYIGGLFHNTTSGKIILKEGMLAKKYPTSWDFLNDFAQDNSGKICYLTNNNSNHKVILSRIQNDDTVNFNTINQFEYSLKYTTKEKKLGSVQSSQHESFGNDIDNYLVQKDAKAKNQFTLPIVFNNIPSAVFCTLVYNGSDKRIEQARLRAENSQVAHYWNLLYRENNYYYRVHEHCKVTYNDNGLTSENISSENAFSAINTNNLYSDLNYNVTLTMMSIQSESSKPIHLANGLIKLFRPDDKEVAESVFTFELDTLISYDSKLDYFGFLPLNIFLTTVNKDFTTINEYFDYMPTKHIPTGLKINFDTETIELTTISMNV